MKDAQTIAKTMADKKVSPKGIGSAIRMIQYFINRAGKGLSPTRRRSSSGRRPSCTTSSSGRATQDKK